MDLIYRNKAGEDIGVLSGYSFDLAYGSDENDFEIKLSLQDHCCDSGYAVYIEGTEYGGIIDSITVNTAASTVTYKGRTWHGVLESKIICPDSGQDYYSLSGDLNTIIKKVITRLSLGDLFVANTAKSGISKSYQFDRYCTGYTEGLLKMANSCNAKLKFEALDNGKIQISAVQATDYTREDDFDSDLIDFRIEKYYKKINHLVCLGKGELKDRTVINLYADANGNVSQTQTLVGVDEVTEVYDYSSVESADELLEKGTEKLLEYQDSDKIELELNSSDGEYDIGDIVGATEHITNITIRTAIRKKVVKIEENIINIEYTIGE